MSAYDDGYRDAIEGRGYRGTNIMDEKGYNQGYDDGTDDIGLDDGEFFHEDVAWDDEGRPF